MWFFIGFIVSIACLIIALIFFKNIWWKNKKSSEQRYSLKTLLFNMMLFVFFSIFLLRLTVGNDASHIKDLIDDPNEKEQLFSQITNNENIDAKSLSSSLNEFKKLSFFEQVGNSALHALQTFSLDESYTEYYVIGKQLMYLKGIPHPLIWLFCFHTIFLNIIAPVSAGATIIGLISELLPTAYVWFINIFSKKRKYYFSELNDKSLALAENILDNDSSCKLIFTDAYTDDEEETGSERRERAISMGAVCIKQDIQFCNIKKIRRKEKTVFILIDESENSNFQHLTALLDKSSEEIGKIGAIYIFASDKKISGFNEEVEFIKKQKENNKTSPTIIPVNCIYNMTLQLFTALPLYEPLIGKKKKVNGNKELTVTIFGSGVIGTEFFFTTYWCGQMLDTELKIRIVSKEKEDDFRGKINNINPEIFETGKIGSDLLRVNDDFTSDEPGIPYMDFKYIESDVMAEDPAKFLLDNGLIDTDYYIVALGSDEDNFTVADRLRQITAQYHLACNDKTKKTVISYVIYNSALCKSLNENCRYRYVPGETGNDCDIYMYAFGDLKSLYGLENGYLKEILQKAIGISETYKDKSGEKNKDKKVNKDSDDKSDTIDKFYKSIYNSRSNISRSVHILYKIYSAGKIHVSVFNKNIKTVNSEVERYTKLIMEDRLDAKKKDLLNNLAWLEHRRWNAYMRADGYRTPSNIVFPGGRTFDFSAYYRKDLSEIDENSPHKFESLKLHPCIVECSKKGIHACFDDRGILINESEMIVENDKGDLIDNLSWERYNLQKQCEEKHRLNPEDFKRWDYPSYDFDNKEGKISYSDKKIEDISDNSGNNNDEKDNLVSGSLGCNDEYRKYSSDGTYASYISKRLFEEKIKTKFIEILSEGVSKIEREKIENFAKGYMLDPKSRGLSVNCSTPFTFDKPFENVKIEMIEKSIIDDQAMKIIKEMIEAYNNKSSGRTPPKDTTAEENDVKSEEEVQKEEATVG